MMLTLLLSALVLGSGSSVPVEDKMWQCGYDSCTQAEPGLLNVHIVPHTHDDVGWLKTVDQYYYGSRNNIQKAGVQYILDTVVKELWEDPKRRFMYVETAFFWKWWTKQTDAVKHKVQVLVQQGRLQFVGGAWSMNDEAASHYQSTIDQFTWGLRKLNQTFGPCGLPRVGWQIDPFGHSREFASLLAGMGYDGLFLGRIDYQDKLNRKSKKTMEMLWRGDDDLGAPSDIFTGVLYNTYSPPAGFCFDVLCNDEPVIDDVDSPMYNVDERILSFLRVTTQMSSVYNTNNILVTMGDDFQYQDAGMWYRNLDKLIEYANLKAAKDGLDVKLFYSTPDCYLKAVKDANPTLPTKQDDFFPYASDSTAYWTGYFTSRPTTKYFERQGNSYLQMVKQIQVNAGLEEHNRFVLNELKSAMGIMQHHDAITGTEKQHVSRDYERILNSAIEDALLITRHGLNKLIQGDGLKPPLLTLDRCNLNVSECATSENSQKFVVTLYNPLAWKVDSAPVRIPVTEGEYAVFAPNGDQIDAQLVELPEAVNTIPLRTSKATHELVFLAYNLKPLGYKNFYVKKLKLRRTRNVELDRIDSDDTEKRLNEFNDNVNDYWKNMQDKTYIERERKIEDESYIESKKKNEYESLDSDIEDVMIDEPKVKVYVNTDNDKYRDPTLDVLKDKNHKGPTPNIEELGKLLKEARMKMISDLEMRDEELKDGEGVERRSNLPNFEGVDMRLLADEPRLVERIPEDTFLENDILKLRINNTTGKITHVSYGDEETVFEVQMLFYPGCAGNNTNPDFRSSGAYIFRPNATAPTELLSNYSGKIIKGKVVEEVQYKINEFVSFTMRLYKDKNLNFIENDWVVGSIPIDDNIGKEVIVRYITGILNNGEFKTDSNGRQMLKRKLNQRPDYNLTIREPIGGNYYPVTNRISIEDGSKRMSVITDRSQGGSSLNEGDIELMLHRRLLRDDAFGVGEALNEIVNGIGLNVRGTHRIIMSKATDIPASINERKNVLKTQLAPHIFVSDAANIEYEDWIKLENCLGGLKTPVPEGIHLLTLEPWDNGDILMRLENYLEVADGSSNVEVDVSDMFSWLKINGLKETTLAANQWVDGYKKWKWERENEFVANFNNAYGSFDTTPIARDVNVENKIDGLKVTLKPKQIRTLIVSYDYVSS